MVATVRTPPPPPSRGWLCLLPPPEQCAVSPVGGWGVEGGGGLSLYFGKLAVCVWGGGLPEG